MSNSLDALPLQQRKPLRISTDIALLIRTSPSNSSSSSSSPTCRNTTPGTPPSTGTPQCSFHVLCMHDFESSDPVQLSFRKGEVLTIIREEDAGWWAAMRLQGDRIGWIPSSFVMPVDGNKIARSPDERPALWSHDNLNDPPLSAVYDQWVPAHEDYTALAFRLVSPAESTLYKGFFDSRLRNRGHESHFSLSNDERPSDTRLCPLSPLLWETGESKLSRPTNLPPHDATLRPHPRPHRILDIKDPTSQNGNCSEDGVQSHPRLSKDSCTAGPGQGNSKFESSDLAISEPDNVAERLCVLMHTLCTEIRQNDCFDWIMARRHTSVTGLRCFYDMHGCIASRVQTSILVHDDIMGQTETLDFWIKDAERCHALRNFDSSCGIILALSGSPLSSLASVWPRRANKRTLGALRDMVGVNNEFDAFMHIVDATSLSVPFVRRCLNHIKKQHLEHSNGSPHQPGHAVAVSALLCCQSSPFDFKVTKSPRSFIDDELQALRLPNNWLLARST